MESTLEVTLISSVSEQSRVPYSTRKSRMRSLNPTSKARPMDKKRDTAPEESDIQTMILPLYNRKPMYYPNHPHWRQADASISHASASPSSPGLYTWGASTLYILLWSWVSSKNLFQTQDENQVKTKYKELFYLNPIVSSLISGSYQMSKRMTGSSLLGPLSSTWFVRRLCPERPETLRPDILAKNCSDFSSVHQA